MADFKNITDGVVSEIAEFVFNTTDYVLFVIMLCISAAIGVYFGFFAKSADTTEEYLMGGKRMKTLPIAISLVASQLSGLSIMTTPAEMYAFGINWYFTVLSIVAVVPILNWIVIPVFYNNNITNCYEYLERRFNKQTRIIQTFGFVFHLCFMLPVFIFVPALAFSQVTGFNVHVINTIVCSICIFYTMFGGIKAVVWTDVVQAAIMLISVILVCVLGTQKSGGFYEVLRIAREGGRLDINYDFDLKTRSTLWNVFPSATLFWVSYVGLNQSCVQRIVSLPSLQHAKRSLILFGIGFFIILTFNCFTGTVMYVRYHNCDPILAGYVEKADKLMPYFVEDVVGHLSGMPGIFISCVFSAALSTMSASLNSLAGIVYFDYIKPHIRHTEQKANFIMKTFVFVAGIYCIFGGFAVAEFSYILQIVYSVIGVTFGSVFGVFMLGLLVPRVHGRAALYAVITSMLGMLIFVITAQGRLNYESLPVTTDGCAMTNVTTRTTAVPTPSVTESTDDFNIFDISFNWYTILGSLIVWVVGVPLSYILKPSPDEKFDPKLLAPFLQPYVEYELAQAEELSELRTSSKPKA